MSEIIINVQNLILYLESTLDPNLLSFSNTSGVLWALIISPENILERYLLLQ